MTIKKTKPSVGLILADTESYVLANNAIQHCVNAFNFDQVTIFTDQTEYWPQYRTVQIPKMQSVADYNRIILEELPTYIDTDFVVIAQFDGFILDGSRFSDEFFNYDYIGAVWPDQSQHQVGNGGFSWRSRKLIQAIRNYLGQYDGIEAEDLFICRRLRNLLEQEHGCRFADSEMANSFSHESVLGNQTPFGFHGVFHLPMVYRNTPSYLIDNLPDRSLRHQLGFIQHGVGKLDDAEREIYRRLIAKRLIKMNPPLSPPQLPLAVPDLFSHLRAAGHDRSPFWKPYEEKPQLVSDKRLIAYYLPQFHTIPENDENWGKGFTEWRNVARSLPLFEGHYQPRHPGDLGFYDLNNDHVLEQQAHLAHNYGINGWAFYHYWFDGKKLLDMPIEKLWRRKDIEIDYCVFWANENWTRSWDGMQSNVLLEQKHSASDDIAFIESISKYFEDDRYIRFLGRPVLMMYRPQLLPDSLATTDRWRNWCVQHGLPEPYLVATQAYGLSQPSQYGFDASAEFPPHRGTGCNPNLLRAPAQLRQFGPPREIHCIDYSSAVNAWSQRPPTDSEKLFKCVFPMWDNSSRRTTATPTVFQGSTPNLYETWLRFCLDQAEAGDLVFVNAWNEWAEGAYLEPDLYMGHAYLEATWKALHQGTQKF